MKNIEFDKILQKRMEKMQAVLGSKAAEYASQSDRLHNFKVAARLDGSDNLTPEQALWGMLRKHLASVIDMVDGTAMQRLPAATVRDEKIGDTINYLVLLEALFVERDNKRITAGGAI